MMSILDFKIDKVIEMEINKPPINSKVSTEPYKSMSINDEYLSYLKKIAYQ
jgi:hypothetical protein